MDHIVIGACAVIRDDAGKLRYYYQGSGLPDDLPKDEITRLTDAGLVLRVAPLETQPAELATSPAGPLDLAAAAEAASTSRRRK